MNDASGHDDHDPTLAAIGRRLRDDVAMSAPPTTAELGAGHRRRSRRRLATTSVALVCVAAVAGVGVLLVTGDDTTRSELASTGSTTSELAPTGTDAPDRSGPAVDLGPAVECRPAMTVGFDLSEQQTAGTVRRTQEELARTVEQVTAYAFAQPDVVESGFDNDASGSLAVAVFADGSDLAAHLAALRGLVEHPDSVVVRGAPWSRAEMTAAQHELSADPAAADGGMLSIGPRWDGLQVQLRADQLPLAERFAATHPGMIQFVIGAKRYDSQGDGGLRRCRSGELAVAPLPTGEPLERTGPADPGRIYVEGAEYPGSAPAGTDVGVEYELRSDRPFTWTPATTGPVEGVVVRAGTDEVVGALSGRVRTRAMPTPVTAAPGEPLVVTVVASTGSVDDGDDPALPPGDYEILASIELDGVEHLLPRVPITLGPAADFSPDYCALPSC